MRSFLLLFWLSLGLPWSAPAQTLNGKVILGPKVTDPPLGGVRVEVTDFTTATSDPETGTFSLQLPGLRPGAKVPLDLVKSGYAVINREATQPRLPDHPLERTVVHMAPQTQRDEMALAFYRITVERNIQVNFDSAAKRFAEDANYEAIGKLHREKETALNLADSLAARLARFDPQTASDELTRAMQLYQEGKVQAALDILDADKIAARIAARKEVMAEMTEANAQDIQALLQAAEMAISDFQFEKATAYYQAAVDADSTDVSNLKTFANYLLEQNQDQQALRLYQQALRQASDTATRASLLINLGNAYANLNRYEAAIDAYDEALEIYRRLAQDNPQRFEPDVAATLNNLGLAYADLTRYEEAIAAYDEALEIRRRLAQDNPPRFEPKVGITLNNLGIAYADLNRYEAAIAAYDEALEIQRRLAQDNPPRFEPEVGTTLNNLGIVYDDLTRYEAALGAYDEALEIQRRLAQENPQRFEPEVGNTLNNLGIAYADLNRYEAAIAAHDEALEIRRRLAQENPQRFEPDLAETLHNLGTAYADLNRYEAAIGAYDEALEIYRRLAQDNPPRFELYLGATLNNLGNAYVDLNRYEEAIGAYDEALEIRRRLAQDNPPRFEPNLAMTLSNKAFLYKAWLDEKPTELIRQQGLSAIKASDSVLAHYPRRDIPAVKRSLAQIEYLQHWFEAPDVLAKACDNKGYALVQARQNDSAWHYFRRAVMLYEDIPVDSLSPTRRWYASFAYEHYLWFVEDPAQCYPYQKTAVGHVEAFFAANPEDEDAPARVASMHYDLSWFALFVGECKEAEASARRSLALDPESTGVIANLAAALLLQGKFEAAQEWYLDYADQPWPDGQYETFREVFLADWEELEAAGVTHPDVAKIRALLRP